MVSSLNELLSLLLFGSVALLLAVILIFFLSLMIRRTFLTKMIRNNLIWVLIIIFISHGTIAFLEVSNILTGNIVYFIEPITIFVLITLKLLIFSDLKIFNESLVNIIETQDAILNNNYGASNWKNILYQGELKLIKENLSLISNKIRESRVDESFFIERFTQLVGTFSNELKELLNEYNYISESIIELETIRSSNRTFWEQINETLKHQQGVILSSLNQMENASSLVNTLTDQISLVSINASIESAKVGELGEGFNLVAENIRDLSVRSRDSSEDLNSRVKDLTSELLIDQKEIFDKVKKINVFFERMDEILTSIGNLTTLIGSFVMQLDDYQIRSEKLQSI